ncbi:10111_t:CDS:1, partial [Gigaspora margarita]
MLNTQSINQNTLTSEQDKSLDLAFQTYTTEISSTGKKNLITKNLIDLYTEPLIDNTTLNRVEKSSNIQFSTETQDM